MEVKDELLKDLEGALRLYVDPEKIDCVWVNLDPPGYGQGGIGLDQIAARLAALGYRKVTTCEKCKWWTDSGDKMWGTCKKPYESADITTVNYYCGHGEPKEAKE